MTQVLTDFENLIKRMDADSMAAAERASFGGDAIELAGAVKTLALQDLRRALSITESFRRIRWSDAREESRLLATRAHVLCYANQFADARTAITEAADLARSAGSSEEIGQVELAAVQLFARQGELGEAEDAANRAFEAYSNSGNLLAQGKSLLNLGIVLRMRDRPADALARFDQALSFVEDDVFLRGAVASNRAEVYLDLDRFAEAEEDFESALRCFADAGHDHAAAIVEGNLADLLSSEGRFDEALERFERAMGYLASSGAEADAMRLRAEEAEALCMIGAVDSALEAYAQCLPSLEAAGLMKELCRARTGLAMALIRIGAHEEAGRVLQQCGRDWRSLGSEVAAAVTDATLAAMCIRNGEFAEADKILKQVKTTLNGRPVRLARAQADIVSALIDKGRFDEASREIRRFEELTAALKLLPLRIAFNHLSGRLLLNQGNAAQAVRPLALAMNESERLRSILRAEQHRMAFGESWRQLYLDVCRAGIELGNAHGVALAFDAIERIRARTVLDALGSNPGHRTTLHRRSPNDQSEIEAEYEACLEVLNVLYNRLGTNVETDEAETRDSLICLSDLEGQASRLRDRLASTATTRVQLSEPLPLEEAQRGLSVDTACIHFFQDEDQVSALVVQRDHTTAHRRLSTLERVSQLISRIRMCSDVLVTTTGTEREQWHNALLRALSRIGALLIEPLADELNGFRRLGVATFGLLSEVPWPLVRFNSSRLGTRHVLTVIPSVSVAARLSDLDQPSHLRMVSIGVHDEAAPRMSAEAGRAAELIPDARLLLEEEATAERVLDAMAEAGLVHLSAHCVYSPLHPMSSRIRLTDRWITARELVAAVRPGCRFVLAGCESGRVGGPSTEDRLGFIRALLASGAGEVLAALSPLNDEISEELFGIFYQKLANQAFPSDLATALHQTQDSMEIRGHSDWLWGNLFVTGGCG